MNNIPQAITDIFKFSTNAPTAHLAQGRKTYTLSSNGDRIKAARHYDGCVATELDRLEAQGYCVNRNDATAWKRIELSDVPQAAADDWRTWDEY